MRWNGTSLKSNHQLVEDEAARPLQDQSAPTASVTAWARAGNQRAVVLEKVSSSVMVSVASSLCLQMVVDPAVPEVKSDEEASMICGANHSMAFLCLSGGPGPHCFAARGLYHASSHVDLWKPADEVVF